MQTSIRPAMQPVDTSGPGRVPSPGALPSEIDISRISRRLRAMRITDYIVLFIGGPYVLTTFVQIGFDEQADHVERIIAALLSALFGWAAFIALRNTGTLTYRRWGRYLVL